MKKLYDLAVKTGSYEKAGDTKNRYENIGAIFENEDGGRMLFIKRSFNPAGVPFREGSESILISMFKPKTDEQSETPSGAEQVGNKFADGEIPF